MPRHRDSAQIERDRKVMASLYLQGIGQYEIANRLGLSQTTVSRDLKVLHKTWLKSALVDLNEARSRELAKIDHLELTYWEAWIDSCKDKEQTTMTAKPGQEGGAAVAQMVTRTYPGRGNSAFLAGVERCIKMRTDILGANAPRLIAVVDEDFDQEEWAAGRAKRQAAAMAILDEAEECGESSA